MTGPQPGDCLELTIIDVAFGGDGVGRTAEGFVVFVPFSAVGDQLRIEITGRKARLARGKIVEILIPSAQREKPLCPYYQTCGGCQYQHLTYAEELRLKEKQVRDAFKNIGGFTDAPLRPIIASPQPYHYRNRITVHAAEGKIGFRGQDPQQLVDIAFCPLAMPEVNEELRKLREIYPGSGHFSLRHPDLPPSGFFQANHLLLATLRELVSNSFSDKIKFCVEGYCGGGFFTEKLLDRFDRVIGIENDPRTLKETRRLPQERLELIEGTVEEELEKTLTQFEGNQTAVLLDPPREGLPRSVVRALSENSPAELSYLSCNPATLARDAETLVAHYQLISLQPIDLFPRTAQIECLTIWRKKLS